MKRFIVSGKVDYEDYEEYISEVDTINDIQIAVKNYLSEANEDGLRTHLYLDFIKIIDSQKYKVYKFRIYENDYDLKYRIEDLLIEIKEQIKEL